MFPIPLFPLNPWKHCYLHCFLQFFHVPMPLANSNIYTKNDSKTLSFSQCFYNVFRQKHRNLHVFRHKVGPNHWFVQCFQCSGIQKPFKISLFSVFSFLSVLPLPEAYQNDPKFHFNTVLSSDTQKSSKNVANTTWFWSRCETVFVYPPAKADIATAILTNVIEHLVWLFARQ